MADLPEVIGANNKLINNAHTSMLDPARASTIHTYAIPSNAAEPTIDDFVKYLLERIQTHELIGEGNKKIVIFTHNAEEVNEIKERLDNTEYHSTVTYCVPRPDTYGAEERSLLYYNNDKKNIIVMPQESIAADLLKKSPNIVYWYNCPKFAEYFFKFILTAEHQVWCYWETSTFNWAVINGMIRLYHSFHYRIPGWLLEMYKTCRPSGSFDVRRDPQIPVRPLLNESQNPRRITENETVTLEPHMASEPFIETKKQMTEVLEEMGSNNTAFYARFVQRYI